MPKVTKVACGRSVQADYFEADLRNRGARRRELAAAQNRCDFNEFLCDTCKRQSEVNLIKLTEPEIVDVPGKTLVGVSDAYDMTRRSEIPALYERFFGLRDQFQNIASDVLYGVSMDAKPDGTFHYGVGMEVTQEGILPKGGCHMFLFPGLYAVFTQRTAITELPVRFDKVFSEWLPNAPFVQREGAVFERYPDDSHPEEGKMLYEIWVPVTRA